MAFQKKTWLARLGQGLNKFIFNGGSKVTLDSSPDVVTQEGTPLSADNMNDLEDRIDSEFTNVNGMITSLSGSIPTIEVTSKLCTFSDGNTSASIGTSHDYFIPFSLAGNQITAIAIHSISGNTYGLYGWNKSDGVWYAGQTTVSGYLIKNVR